VGSALGSILEKGDVVRLSRYGTADLAISVRNGQDVKIGLGAVGISHLGPRISVEDDTRARETSLLSVIRSLDKPDTTLIWLNVADVDREVARRDIQNAPPGRVVTAIPGPDPDARLQMHPRISDLRGPLPPGRSSYRYVNVDARFKTPQEWVQYVHTRPRTRPDDLWLRVNIDGASTTVREGNYALVDPWHIFVQKVYEPGVPGELSQLGIARTSPAITEKALIESTQAVASRRIERSTRSY
jgi:hypothetical protein